MTDSYMDPALAEAELERLEEQLAQREEQIEQLRNGLHRIETQVSALIRLITKELLDES